MCDRYRRAEWETHYRAGGRSRGNPPRDFTAMDCRGKSRCAGADIDRPCRLSAVVFQRPAETQKSEGGHIPQGSKQETQGWCAMSQKKRERGEGRIFVRGRIGWIQHPGARHEQIRKSTGISIDEPNWEKRAAKELRKAIGEVAASIHRDTRSLRYEDLRDSYCEDYRANNRKSLRRNKAGHLYLD